MDNRFEHLFEYKQILTNETPRSLPNERGVLLFTDSNNRPIQLLFTASIRRTVLSKWAGPFDETSRKASLRTEAAAVFYTLLACEYHGHWFYNRLTHLLFPQKEKEMLSLPPAHCVRLSPREQWAAFTVSSQPFKDGAAHYWGPFPTREAADFFARTWNDIFCLCRNRALALGGGGSKCTYFQMNLCPADCIKKVSENPYPERLKQALRAAQSSPNSLMPELTEQMKTLAAQLQFERAQIIKKQLESLEKLQTVPYRWTTDLNRLKILHISQGRSIRFQKHPVPIYQAFLITGRTAEKLPPFTLDSIERLLEAVQTPPGRCFLEPSTPSEHLSLLSLFLYKTRPPGLWLNLNEPLKPQQLRNQIVESFEKTPAENQ
ncbi:MAG TPA: UvrB/UvrC motif-containing protein [Anaerohalosphaeraceae bacterium]|nr:UvrB/UvrC motif-containing protein [Anaerohalosphaeraceae bacterium]HOL87907.1 UvrB/UvrC motif-containing protein [Anaerohalosphaeraceae bacterium]HPP55405.1 UvrB/UvrC motif-containing protein [Anaerohalosphaeraceae bacterium]